MPDDKTLPMARAAGTATKRTAAHLFVVLEAGRPLAGGARYELSGIDEVVLGRGAAREATREGKRLIVRIPDPLMSSTHARIVREPGGFSIEDSGSKNGSFADGARVTKQRVAAGALLDLGTTLFTVQHDLPTPPLSRASVDAAALAGRELGMTTLLPAYAVALDKLGDIARTGLFVLLLGETGTGKELLARGVHGRSARTGAFVPVNCGAIPENLVEGQLFGHVRGAFSGAARDEPGFVRASDRGTLLLDEIGDLPKSSQAALLRVLQEHEVTAVGATRAQKVDLRVIAATHRPIASLATGAGFRSDLFARLAGYTHELLPLRERMEDLGLLVAAILPRVAPEGAATLTLELDLARALFHHDWPLNVRELHNALAASVVFATDGVLTLAHAPEALRRATPPEEAPSAALAALTPEQEAQKEELAAVLGAHAGNVSEAARVMKCSRMQVHRWMRRFGLDPAAYRR